MNRITDERLAELEKDCQRGSYSIRAVNRELFDALEAERAYACESDELRRSANERVRRAEKRIAELEAQVAALRKLPGKWRAEAMSAVPPDYADRDLHHKYLRLDVHAGGLNDCADELEALLTQEK